MVPANQRRQSPAATPARGPGSRIRSVTPPAERIRQGGWRRRRWSRPMSTTFKAAVDSYLRAKTLSRGTRNEYFSTLRKWEQWGGGSPIEALQHKEIREFLDWVHERARAKEGLCALAGSRRRTNVEAGVDAPWELKDLRKTCATY